MSDFTCNHKCSNCGQCCIPFLPITRKEYKDIKEYIKKNNIKPLPIIEGNNVYMDCCFHDRKNKKCIIYPVRPQVCQTYLCCKPDEELKANREFYDGRAYYNGKHLDRVYPFDLLFYNDPTTLLHYMAHEIKPKNEEEVKQFLIGTGHKDLAEHITCQFGGEE